MNIEETWKADEERADALLKTANKYVGVLKTWKKACQTGHVANRQKAAQQAEELALLLAEPTAQANSAWDFDVRDYLSGEEWRTEIRTVAAEKYDLRLLEENDTLISSPVIVRSQPGRAAVLIGKVSWPLLRPQLVAAELKRLRDRTASANSQEFLESLYAVYSRQKQDNLFVSFKDIYDLFSLTPGWKKENPPAAFGQAIYALHRSDVKTTRKGYPYDIVYPTGKVKESDVFTVIAEDGRTVRYLGIRFQETLI